MTTPAVDLLALARPAAFMPSRELVAGQQVVEIGFIEAHHIEIPTVVIAVAFCAILSFYFLRGVITAVAIHTSFEFFLATQAFVVGNLAAEVVTLGTLGNTFQVPVRVREIAGRQLRGESGRREQQQEECFQVRAHVSGVF